jgi:hypothetical protein
VKKGAKADAPKGAGVVVDFRLDCSLPSAALDGRKLYRGGKSGLGRKRPENASGDQ